jgi:hypothetical protein
VHCAGVHSDPCTPQLQGHVTFLCFGFCNAQEKKIT